MRENKFFLVLGLVLLIAMITPVYAASGDADSDQDGFIDATDNCPFVYNNDQADYDGDLVGDACDNCPYEYGAVYNYGCPEQQEPDNDKDGIADKQDNCMYIYNPFQEDKDQDGLGDVCDECPYDYGAASNYGCPEVIIEDTDKDGFVDGKDNCIDVYNPDQADMDNDGVGDACDQCDNRDPDGDSVMNCEDKCPNEYGEVYDYGCPVEKDQALDYDKDGIIDSKDNCVLIYNVDQTDSDFDGFGDACDKCPKEAAMNTKEGCPDTTSQQKDGPGQNQTNGTTTYNTTVMLPGGYVPVENGTQICRQISGMLSAYPYESNSLRLKIVRMDSTRWSKAPFKSNALSYTTSESYTEYPTRPTGSRDFTYLSRCIGSGLWVVYPEYNPTGSSCEPANSWNVPYLLVDLTRNYTATNVNFVYTPEEMSAPLVSMNINPRTPSSSIRFNVTITGSDNDSGIRATEVIIRRNDGTVLTSATCLTANCTVPAGPFPGVETAEVTGSAYDNAGNKCSLRRWLELSSCFNLIQDGNETGVDCGGRCGQCIPCTWCGRDVTPLAIHGRPNEGYIDVVFMAGHSYTGNHTYSGDHNFAEFLEDARTTVVDGLYKLDTMTDPPISSDYKRKFNFYYWNTAITSDTSETCAWPVASNFWESAPFTDNVLILDAEMSGGCCNHVPPRTLCHAPGRWSQSTYAWLERRRPEWPYDVRTPLGLALHEEGHGVFGLVDTYCGPTWYGQHDPSSNVWSSMDNCLRDTSAQGWGADKGQCRQIVGDYAFQHCNRSFYSFDYTAPLILDIMHTANPPFGVAGTRRINLVLDTMHEIN
ncbi:MAG: thrombospondin type 3 repeat-containing protein [Candidatus Micrarchaeota archaeon]